MDPRIWVTSVILKTVLGVKQNQKGTKLSSLIIFMFIHGIDRKYHKRVFLGRVPEVKTSAILCALKVELNSYFFNILEATILAVKLIGG